MNKINTEKLKKVIKANGLASYGAAMAFIAKSGAWEEYYLQKQGKIMKKMVEDGYTMKEISIVSGRTEEYIQKAIDYVS